MRCVLSVVLHAVYDAVFGAFDESNDVFDLLAHGYLFTDFYDGVLQAEIALVDQTVRVGNVAQDAVGRVEVLKDKSVHAVVAGRISAENDIGGDVLLHAATALYQGIAAHVNVLLDDGSRALYGTVVDFAFACNAYADTHDAIVVHKHVVADMNLIHEEIAVADGGCLAFIAASGDDNVLADTVIVAYDDAGFSSLLKMEILRGGSDDGVLVDNVVTSHLSAFQNRGMGHDDAVVTDFNAFLDVGKRLYFNIVSQTGFGIDEC